MKRRINLLSINFTKRELSEVVMGFRMKAFIALIILIVLAGIEYGVFLYMKSETEKFSIAQENLEQYLVTNDDIDQRLKYFFYKYNLLNDYLEEDANGFEHYTQVRDLLAQHAPQSQIISFSYKNNGETTFTLSFPSYDEASSFIALLETPIFLDEFQFVKLDGFEAISVESATGFDVTIFAQFIEENET